MPDETLEQRLAAVERAVSGTDGTGDPGADQTDLADRLAALETEVAELEAAVQAVRGYVGSVKHVNDEVEQRADAAMAKAQAVEQTLEANRLDGTARAGGEQPPADRDEQPPADRDARPSGDHGERPSEQCPRCGDGTASGPVTDHVGSGAGRSPVDSRDGRVADGGNVADGSGLPGSTDHWPESVGHRSLDDRDDPDEDGLLAHLREVF